MRGEDKESMAWHVKLEMSSRRLHGDVKETEA